MKHIRNQQGAAMVELALVIPLFLAVLLAVIDFGLYFNNRVALQTAAYNYAKQANANNDTGICVTPVNDSIIAQSLAGIIENTANIRRKENTIGTPTTQRYRVDLRYDQPVFSAFTQHLYPIVVTGVAVCQ